jgi:predicted dehydrogenase
MAEVGDLTRTPGFEAERDHWIGTGWVDVENWASAVLTFEDGSRGIVWAAVAEDRAPVSDGALGLDVIRVVYGGYLSAAEGRRVQLSD